MGSIAAKRDRFRVLGMRELGTLVCLIGLASAVAAAPQEAQKADATPDIKAAPTGPGTPSIAGGGAGSPGSDSPHAALLREAKSVSGMWTLHQKGSNLFVELMPSDYNSDFLVLISIARGIGRRPILGGYSWGSGEDDWLWQFRKIDNQVHIVRRNVRFRATTGSREAFAVRNAFTDSVLFSLPIMTKGPRGGDLVDLSSVFMSDLPQISNQLPGFSFAANRSTWETVKAFQDNVELQIAATYASGGYSKIETVADSRGATVSVHYSISRLPQTGYQPRMADDRVGYFLTVIKDFSKSRENDQFIRYINRWHIQKDDPNAAMSPPKQPLIFWIEKTVPAKYRPAIQAGILEWNKAFEKAGLASAIEVRTQPVDADWDPEDVRYNTFRWITANAGFAMGPSRVNPYTGQILDADIIFDADFLSSWEDEFEVLTPQTITARMDEMRQHSVGKSPSAEAWFANQGANPECTLSHGMASQFAFGTAVLKAHFADAKQSAEQLEKLIMQGLKETSMHEVGHTLGLRHNFKASAFLPVQDANNTEKVKLGMVGSVMDYSPTFISPKGVPQGDYYTTTIGPYDFWAIQYGYSPLSGGTEGEAKELQKIAARSGEAGLAYATDEESDTGDPDPLVNRFDFGSDTIEYAKLRAKLVAETIPGLADRLAQEGDDYSEVRRAFSTLIRQYGYSAFLVSRYVGGMNVSRSHKGDKDAKPPYTPIDVAKQREALAFIEEQVFSDKPFQFPPEIYQYLASANWDHWGVKTLSRADFPIHDVIVRWQTQILVHLTSTTVLQRIHDTELKMAVDKDVLTTAELLERLTKSIFSEVDQVKEGDYSNRKPAISSIRRNLQRTYLKLLSNIAMGAPDIFNLPTIHDDTLNLFLQLNRGNYPQDCQTVAFAELSSLEARINLLLKSNVKLDSYTRAHLTETASRVQKVLDARVITLSP